MLIRYLESLRAHGEWADRRLHGAVQSAPTDVSVALRELAHIRGAQDIWIARIEGRRPTLPVWPEWSALELERAAVQLDASMRALISRLTPETLGQTVAYATLAGVPFSTPLADILLHLLTHGQYHRGKANVALRSAGIEPVGVDFILWQREVAA